MSFSDLDSKLSDSDLIVDSIYSCFTEKYSNFFSYFGSIDPYYEEGIKIQFRHYSASTISLNQSSSNSDFGSAHDLKPSSDDASSTFSDLLNDSKHAKLDLNPPPLRTYPAHLPTNWKAESLPNEPYWCDTDFSATTKCPLFIETCSNERLRYRIDHDEEDSEFKSNYEWDSTEEETETTSNLSDLTPYSWKPNLHHPIELKNPTSRNDQLAVIDENKQLVNPGRHLPTCPLSKRMDESSSNLYEVSPYFNMTPGYRMPYIGAPPNNGPPLYYANPGSPISINTRPFQPMNGSPFQIMDAHQLPLSPMNVAPFNAPFSIDGSIFGCPINTSLPYQPIYGYRMGNSSIQGNHDQSINSASTGRPYNGQQSQPVQLVNHCVFGHPVYNKKSENANRTWMEERINQLRHTIMYLHEKLNLERKWLWQEKIMNAHNKDEKEISQLYYNDFHSAGTLSSTHCMHFDKPPAPRTLPQSRSFQAKSFEVRSPSFAYLTTSQRLPPQKGVKTLDIFDSEKTVSQYQSILDDTSKAILHRTERERAHKMLIAQAYTYKNHINNIEKQCHNELQQVHSLMNTLKNIARTNAPVLRKIREDHKDNCVTTTQKKQSKPITISDETQRSFHALHKSYTFGKKVTEQFINSINQMCSDNNFGGTKTDNEINNEAAENWNNNEKQIEKISENNRISIKTTEQQPVPSLTIEIDSKKYSTKGGEKCDSNKENYPYQQQRHKQHDNHHRCQHHTATTALSPNQKYKYHCRHKCQKQKDKESKLRQWEKYQESRKKYLEKIRERCMDLNKKWGDSMERKRQKKETTTRRKEKNPDLDYTSLDWMNKFRELTKNIENDLEANGKQLMNIKKLKKDKEEIESDNESKSIPKQAIGRNQMLTCIKHKADSDEYSSSSFDLDSEFTTILKMDETINCCSSVKRSIKPYKSAESCVTNTHTSTIPEEIDNVANNTTTDCDSDFEELTWHDDI